MENDLKIKRKLFNASLSALRYPIYENSRTSWFKWERRNLYIDEIKAEIFKALVLSDKVVIDLPEPASEAVRLFEWFCQENLIKLVEDGTISFSLGSKKIAIYDNSNNDIDFEIRGNGKIEYNDSEAVFYHAFKTETDLSKN